MKQEKCRTLNVPLDEERSAQRFSEGRKKKGVQVSSPTKKGVEREEVGERL